MVVAPTNTSLRYVSKAGDLKILPKNWYMVHEPRKFTYCFSFLKRGSHD